MFLEFGKGRGKISSGIIIVHLGALLFLTLSLPHDAAMLISKPESKLLSTTEGISL
jgi:hypothetical protein